jgi:hypothetical protein
MPSGGRALLVGPAGRLAAKHGGAPRFQSASQPRLFFHHPPGEHRCVFRPAVYDREAHRD